MQEITHEEYKNIKDKSLMFKVYAELDVILAVTKVSLAFEVSKNTANAFKCTDETANSYEYFTEGFESCFAEINNIIRNTVIPTFEDNYSVIKSLNGEKLFGFDVFITPTERYGFYVATFIDNKFARLLKTLDLKEKMDNELYNASKSVSKATTSIFRKAFINSKGAENGAV